MSPINHPFIMGFGGAFKVCGHFNGERLHYCKHDLNSVLLLGFGLSVICCKNINQVDFKETAVAKGRYNERGVQKEFGRAIGITNTK
ncbi:hypothetical protein ACNKHT_02510 [Shigella flexneri]